MRAKRSEALVKLMVIDRLSGEDQAPDVAKIHSYEWYKRFNKFADKIDSMFGPDPKDAYEKGIKAKMLQEMIAFMNSYFCFHTATSANSAKNAVELIILERNWE